MIIYRRIERELEFYEKIRMFSLRMLVFLLAFLFFGIVVQFVSHKTTYKLVDTKNEIDVLYNVRLQLSEFKKDNVYLDSEKCKIEKDSVIFTNINGFSDFGKIKANKAIYNRITGSLKLFERPNLIYNVKE